MDNPDNGHENYKTEKNDNVELKNTPPNLNATVTPGEYPEDSDEELQDLENDSILEPNIDTGTEAVENPTSLEEDESGRITGLNDQTTLEDIEETLTNLQDDEKSSILEPKSDSIKIRPLYKFIPSEPSPLGEKIKRAPVNIVRYTPAPNSETNPIPSTSAAADEKNINVPMNSSESSQSSRSNLNKIEIEAEEEALSVSESTPLLRLPTSSSSANRNQRTDRILSAIRRCWPRRVNEDYCLRWTCYLVPTMIVICIIMFVVRIFFIGGKNSRFNIFKA